jgi:hypothetical protein
MTQRSIEKAYTMDEAAKVLRICRRKLQDLVARHPNYHVNGRRKLFTESEIIALRAAMHQEAEEQRLREEQCRLNLSRRARGKVRIGPSVAPITGSIWTEAQRRLTALRQQDSSKLGKRTSNVMPLPGPESRRS